MKRKQPSDPFAPASPRIGALNRVVDEWARHHLRDASAREVRDVAVALLASATRIWFEYGAYHERRFRGFGRLADFIAALDDAYREERELSTPIRGLVGDTEPGFLEGHDEELDREIRHFMASGHEIEREIGDCEDPDHEIDQEPT